MQQDNAIYAWQKSCGTMNKERAREALTRLAEHQVVDYLICLLKKSYDEFKNVY